MKPCELVDHIRSNPAELVLFEPLRFRRRTRSNACDFSAFLLALQTSETIRTVECGSHTDLGITEGQWVLLIKTLGIINVQNLRFNCVSGSHNFHPFQAIAEAVKNAQSLRKLIFVLDNESFPKDPSGLTALAKSLREHTALQDFFWAEFGSRLEAEQITPLDPVLRALPGCPHLREVTILTECASADAMKHLLHLPSAANLHLVLEKENWSAVADEIRRGRCNVRSLDLAMHRGDISDATEAVRAVASGIRRDCNLEHLFLQLENGFTDEAGMALAEALRVNKTLRKIDLSTSVRSHRKVQNKATLGTHSYEAFAAMLRDNVNLVLKLPPLETTGEDARLLECRNQIRIEQRLNHVGRGPLLASIQTTREEWVDALHNLNSRDVNDPRAFRVSCLYSLLRLNPSVVCMS